MFGCKRSGKNRTAEIIGPRCTEASSESPNCHHGPCHIHRYRSIPWCPCEHQNSQVISSSLLHTWYPTWWLIPLSKWVITPVINGISRVNPLITGVITHLLSGMSHQVLLAFHTSGDHPGPDSPLTQLRRTCRSPFPTVSTVETLGLKRTNS